MKEAVVTTSTVRVTQFVGAGLSDLTALSPRTGADHIALETPIALEINGISYAVLMASPSDLQDLALGFCLTEGFIRGYEAFYDCEISEGGSGMTLHLQVSAEAEWQLKARRRIMEGRTGCGLCGVEKLQQVFRSLPVVAPVSIPASRLMNVSQELTGHQVLQRITGATHAAAWVSLTGKFLMIREDVGRHNALDKLIGALVREHVKPESGFFLVTSRASFEMVQKAVCFGAGLLAAISAPTSLAVSLAHRQNLALAGFLGSGKAVAYTYADRFSEAF